MSDYDESIDGLVEEEESENGDEYDEEDDDYYYHRRRRWGYDSDDYSDRECKRCKTEDSYVFVTINPVILTNVPKLMDMASVTVAASLWTHVNVPEAVRSVRDRCTKNSTQWSTLCADVIELIAKLPIPKLIAEQIDPYVRKMANEITAWVSYHYRTVFLRNGLDKFVYSHVYHIVWYPNGAIDCVQTARSMLTSVRLSDVEKFKFLCVYCLYDDMEEMSPLIYLDNALDYLSCNEDPMIFYWYCYFRNELDKIPGSINVYMLHHDKVDNWPAKEYFFDRLAYDEQAREAIWLIDKHGAVYQKAVLLKLDETQRLHVYIERATQVIVNYTRPRMSSRFILQTWFEARNLIKQDEFLTLFRELLSSGVKDVVLTEIWASANDDFKQHVVCANVHEIVMKVLTKWRWRDNSDFVFVLLQDSNAMIKQSVTMQEFFSDYCEKLIENSKFQELDRLLVFCLPDADDLAEFKRDFVFNTKSDFFNAHCQTLLMKSEFQDLDQLLEFCLPDPENLLRFKMKFINNWNRNIINTHCARLLISSKFQELGKLLEFCFPDAEDLLQFKMNLVMNSKYNIIKTHCEKLLTNSEFQELDRLLTFCLPDADYLSKFKRNFVYSSEYNFFNDHCEKLLVNGKFQEVDQLLEFCLLDAEDLLLFKKNLVNNSSPNIIKTHCKSLLINSEFQELNRLLTFCLPDADDLVKFKRNFVNSSDSNFFDAQCEKLLVNGKFQELDQLLEFCLLDAEALLNFKTNFINSKHEIINMHCERLLTGGKFQEVARLLGFCFPDAENLLQFKINLVNNSKHTIIKTHCERLLMSSKFQELDRLLTFCLPDADYLAKFKRNFVYSSQSNFFDAHCEKLLVNGKFQEFDQQLKFCLPDVEDFLPFKMKFMNDSKRNVINTHCERLLINSKFQELDRLLQFCLPGAENVARFKINLVLNSKHVGNTCLQFYSAGDLNGLNNYLKQLLTLYPDAVVQFKKNLITSSRGIDMCVGLMDTKFSVLSGILEDVLKDPISITDFKKTIIFSSAAISKLTDSLLNNRLNDVQFCINRYLNSTDDRYTLKKRLIGDITKLIQAILRNNDESYLQTVLIWWFGNEDAVKEFKRKLHLRSVFIEMLKDCVFLEYNKFLTRCRFRYGSSSSSSDFNVLDRFLNWYFQSPIEVKEYKMKVIHSYSKIDMFQTFLRGNLGDMQLKTVLQWFFKNDTAEIARFKKRGGKITNLI
ncbi:uncharacterized protein LOC135848936 [Planococcus citri]|uniref:uncharacterized protein LOC135848936 n=1 Tax=Planococcus citri TaxID=170843 RepID=UPI0031F91A8C